MTNRSRDRIPLFGLLAGSAISILGNGLTALAVPWFVLETTGSALKSGLVAFPVWCRPCSAGCSGARSSIASATGAQACSVISPAALPWRSASDFWRWEPCHCPQPGLRRAGSRRDREWIEPLAHSVTAFLNLNEKARLRPRTPVVTWHGSSTCVTQPARWRLLIPGFAMGDLTEGGAPGPGYCAFIGILANAQRES